MNQKTIICTVTDKGIKVSGSYSRYLIYGVDEQDQIIVLTDSDCLFSLKFNSSDVYAALEEGKTYKFKVGGFRVHILSWYPNILECEKVKR